MSLNENLSEPNSFTMVASRKLLRMSNYVLIFSFFLIIRMRNLQCRKLSLGDKFLQSVAPLYLFF